MVSVKGTYKNEVVHPDEPVEGHDGQVESKDDVLALLARHQDRLRLLGVKRLGLFGSFVRDQADVDS